MKIFAINVKDQNKRRERMLAECARHNLDVELIEGVSGKDLTAAELDKHVADFEESGLTLAEIGCSLSHIKVYRKIVDENIDVAFILEDDAAFKEGIKDVLAKLEQFCKTLKKPHMLLLTKGEKFIANKEINLDDEITLYRYYRGGMAQGYIINLECAKVLLKHQYPVRFVPDDWQYLSIASNIKIYFVVPYSVYTAEGTVTTLPDRYAESAKRAVYRKKIFYNNLYVWIKVVIFRIFIRPFLTIIKPD